MVAICFILAKMPVTTLNGWKKPYVCHGHLETQTSKYHLCRQVLKKTLKCHSNEVVGWRSCKIWFPVVTSGKCNAIGILSSCLHKTLLNLLKSKFLGNNCILHSQASTARTFTPLSKRDSVHTHKHLDLLAWDWSLVLNTCLITSCRESVGYTVSCCSIIIFYDYKL